MRDFVKDGYNALITKKNDINDIVEKTRILIEDINLRKKISVNGMNTAKKFNWNSSTSEMIAYYKNIAQYKVII